MYKTEYLNKVLEELDGYDHIVLQWLVTTADLPFGEAVALMVKLAKRPPFKVPSGFLLEG